MAHIHFNDNTQYGRLLRSMLRINEDADDQIKDVRDCMVQMRSGDGSSAAHYGDITKRFGFADYDSTQGEPSEAQNLIAKAAFEELDSAYSKTSGNGSVSDVRAARDQLFSKLRG